MPLGTPKLGGGTEILMGTPILGEGAPRCQWGPQNWAVGALRPQMGSLILGGGGTEMLVGTPELGGGLRPQWGGGTEMSMETPILGGALRS